MGGPGSGRKPSGKTISKKIKNHREGLMSPRDKVIAARRKDVINRKLKYLRSSTLDREKQRKK